MRRTIKLVGRVPVTVLATAVLASAVGTGVSAVLHWWAVAIVLLVVCQLALATVVLAAIGAATPTEVRTKTDARTDRSLQDVEEKLDLLSSRTVTALERTRSELLVAMRDTGTLDRQTSGPHSR